MEMRREKLCGGVKEEAGVLFFSLCLLVLLRQQRQQRQQRVASEAALRRGGGQGRRVQDWRSRGRWMACMKEEMGSGSSARPRLKPKPKPAELAELVQPAVEGMEGCSAASSVRSGLRGPLAACEVEVHPPHRPCPGSVLGSSWLSPGLTLFLGLFFFRPVKSHSFTHQKHTSTIPPPQLAPIIARQHASTDPLPSPDWPFHSAAPVLVCVASIVKRVAA